MKLTLKLKLKLNTSVQNETNGLHLFLLAQHNHQNGNDEARLFELVELDF